MAGGNSRKRTALVATVLNEAASLDGLLGSVLAQTVPPDEVVIVDGGSSDGTLEILRTWTARLPLRVVARPGASISAGRNCAIRSTSAEVIAVTDAGVWLDERWLEHLLAHLTPDVDVVSGFFRSDPRSVFELAMGATVLPDIEDVRASRFLPSSRSVLFRRSAWERVGGYPEWLDYCEDLVFDLALRRAGCRFAFAPRALVWFRPRGSLRSFFRQYYLYARGDGKADLWRTRHAIRYATYAIAAALGWASVHRSSRSAPARTVTEVHSARRLTASRAARSVRSPLSWTVLALGAVAYSARPSMRLSRRLGTRSLREAAYALALVPIIRLTGDVAKMLGYPVGVLWRLRNPWICHSSS